MRMYRSWPWGFESDVASTVFYDSGIGDGKELPPLDTCSRRRRLKVIDKRVTTPMKKKTKTSITSVTPAKSASDGPLHRAVLSITESRAELVAHKVDSGIKVHIWSKIGPLSEDHRRAMKAVKKGIEDEKWDKAKCLSIKKELTK